MSSVPLSLLLTVISFQQLSLAAGLDRNQTTVPMEEELFRTHVKPMIIFMSITMILALLGNLFLSFVIYRRSRGCNRSLNPVHILLLHSCLADILFALITIFPKLCTIITSPHFYGGDVVCRVVNYLQLLPMWASPFLLVAMSADRYQCICNPWNSLRRNKRLVAQFLAGIAWAFSLLAPIPQLFIFRFVPENNSTQGTCYARFSHPWHGKLYMVWFSIGAWLLPSLASGFFYINVWTHVKKSAASLKTGNENRHNPCSTPSQQYVKRLRHSGNRRRLAAIADQQRGKTVKLTMTIVVCNFLLWAPFCITNIIQQFDSELLDPVISTYIMLFGNLNSCVNPWIYLFFNRSQIVSFLCCQHNGEQSQSIHRGQHFRASSRSTNNHTPTSKFAHEFSQKNLIRNRHRASIPFDSPNITTFCDN